VGFAITFAMAVITVLLIIDMTRRIRRVRYRSEIREKLEAEQRDAKA
jgi:FtsH-binding integral membrane protein